jgi:hypothetical protein
LIVDSKAEGCHPRDIVEIMSDICVFHGERPVFDRKYLDQAAHSYFVSLQDPKSRQLGTFGGLTQAA